MTSVVFRHTLFVLAVVGVVQAQNDSSSDGPEKYIDSSVAWGVAGRIPALPLAGPNSTNAATNVTTNATDYYQFLSSLNYPGPYNGAPLTSVSLLARPGTQFPNASTSFYSYCFLHMFLGSNNLRLAQTDDGSCTQTFGSDCVGNLTQAISQKAAEAYSKGNRGYEICRAIAQGAPVHLTTSIDQTIADFFASEPSCQARRSGDRPFYGYASDSIPQLPGSPYGVSQTLFPGYGIFAFGGVGYDARASSESYDDYYSNDANRLYEEAYRAVYPQIAVVVPNMAPSDIPSSVGMGAFKAFDAYMACPRVTNKTANATVPSPLPAGSTDVNGATGTLGRSAGRMSYLGALLCIVFLSLL